jgi:hypothetical protein
MQQHNATDPDQVSDRIALLLREVHRASWGSLRKSRDSSRDGFRKKAAILVRGGIPRRSKIRG